MINLIPPAAKRRVILEYWIRMVSVWMFMVCGIIIVTTLLLIPVYVLVHSKIEAYAVSATEALNSVAEYDISSSALISASVQANLLLQLSEQENFSDLITVLENSKNAGVSIKSFSFTRTPEGLAPVDITGDAKTRQDLADFREALLKNEAVEKVFLPISNLAEDRNIDFTISVTMKPKP